MTKAIEAYSNSPLRAAVQLVPIFGPAMDALFGAWGAELAQRRVTALMDELRTAVERLDASKIDRAYVESEEFADVLMRAVREAIQTRHRDKIRMLAEVIAGGSVIDRGQSLPAEEALTALGSLSVREIALAVEIHDRSTLDQPLVDLPELKTGGTFAPDGDIRFQVQRLLGAGLLVEDRGLVIEGTGIQPAHLVPTPTLRSIVRMLRAGQGRA